RRLVMLRRVGSMAQPRIHVVLLAAAVPRCGDLGSDSTDAVIPSQETLARRLHRLVPLRVIHAMALGGLTHLWCSSYLACAARPSQAQREASTHVLVYTPSRRPCPLSSVGRALPW